jgi:predicted O-methyltransferase YrrM
MKGKSNSVTDELPWVSFQCIAFLNSYVKPHHRVFEFGGGGSTLYFLNRAAEVVTVEHNREWFSILEEKIPAKKKKGKTWEGAFISAEKGDLVSSPDPANPGHYSSEDEASRGSNYKSYASFIDKFPDGYFDCVVVDGRSRPSCLAHALPKIRKGGIVVLDNSERPYYLAQMEQKLASSFSLVMNDFAPTIYSREFTKTGVWKKN